MHILFAKFRVKVNTLRVIFPLLAFLPAFSLAQVSSVKQLKDEIRNLNLLQTSTKPNDPWTIDNIITTGELSNELSNSKNQKPIVLQVGFDFLYNQEHIPGAIYAGPASKDFGVIALKKAVKNLDKDAKIVIYCGCCPWGHCPNIRPAYKELKGMGFNKVKVLYLPDSFAKDWKGMGYEVEGSATSSHTHDPKIKK